MPSFNTLSKIYKELDSEFQNSNTIIKDLFNSNRDGIILLNIDGFIIRSNQKFQDMVGYSNEELKEMQYKEFIHPKWQNLEEKTIKDEIKKKGNTSENELEYVRKDGKSVNVSITQWQINNSKNQPIGKWALIRDITEQKKAQKQLRESRLRYEDLFNKACFAVVVLNSKGSILDCNLKIEELTGIKKIDFKSKSLTYLLKSLKIENSNQLSKVLLKEIDYNSKIEPKQIVAKDINNDTWNFFIRGRLIEIYESQYIQIILQDITELKQTQSLLNKEKKRAELYIDYATVILVALDTSGNIKMLNRKGYEILEYEEGELLGKNWFDICLPKDYREELLTEFNKYINNNPRTKGKYINPIITKYGKIKHISWENAVLLDKRGEIKSILSSGEDITARILAEKNLAESEKKYKNLYDNFLDGIGMTDLGGRITDCNNSFEKLTGYSLDELKIMNFRDLTPSKWHEMEDKILVEQVLKRGYSDEYEKEYIKKDGLVIPVSLKTWLTYNDEGNPIGYSAHVRDISEKKKAERIILRENERLMELEKIRQDFLIRISHELKTPLVSICGATDLIKDVYAGQYSDKVKTLIDVVERGGKRLKTLVDDLIDVSKIEYNALYLNMKETDITKLILEVIDDVIFFAYERKIKINFDSEGICYGKVDELRFKQVISNILLNAIKYTPPHGTISVVIKNKDILIELIISDTGIGFTESEKKLLFRKFGKIERFGKGLNLNTEGSGLGLYLSKKIVDMHKGRIWVESEGRDKGSTFIIQIFK